MKTTIHYETLDRLEDENEAKSPILHQLKREIEETKNTFDLVRLLTSYVISLEKQTAIRKEEVEIYFKNKSYPDPLLINEERFKREYLGNFIPEQGD